MACDTEFEANAIGFLGEALVHNLIALGALNKDHLIIFSTERFITGIEVDVRGDLVEIQLVQQFKVQPVAGAASTDVSALVVDQLHVTVALWTLHETPVVRLLARWHMRLATAA